MTSEMLVPARGRHAREARLTGTELARAWARRGRWWYLPLVLSDTGRELIEHKYDAFATDRAYENRPAGRLGPLGWLLDWLVLRQDIHAALRERLANVVAETSAAVRATWDEAEGPLWLVSAPCGLGRDLGLTWRELGAPAGRLSLLGLDLDERGEVLPAARVHAAAAGLPLATARCDLLAAGALDQALGGRPADLFLCIGLSVWLSLEELDTLLAQLHGALRPGGRLVVDHFLACGSSRFARDFEMRPFYHRRGDFEAALGRAGFQVEARRATRRDMNVVFRCRRAS